LVPLAALTDTAQLGVAPATLPATAAHAEPETATTPAAPTSTAFDARTAPAAFRSASPTADLPGPALAAYQRAEAVINASSSGCHLPWELLAAVGQVETDHGRRTPPAATSLPDSDAGLYDGSAAHDVPIGPMQLTPQAWSAVGVDADGDGNRDARDLDDAALGLAVLLCGTGADLATEAGQRTALAKHNQDPGYLDLVIRLAGDYALPVTLSASMVSPSVVAPSTTEKAQAARKAGAGNELAAPLPAGGGTSAEAPAQPPVDEPGKKPTDPTTPDPEPTDPEPTDPEPTEPGQPSEEPTEPGQPGEEPTEPGQPDDTCTPEGDSTPSEETPTGEPTDEPRTEADEPADGWEAEESPADEGSDSETDEPECGPDDEVSPGPGSSDPSASREPQEAPATGPAGSPDRTTS